jgi:hypothetical protein
MFELDFCKMENLACLRVLGIMSHRKLVSSAFYLAHNGFRIGLRTIDRVKTRLVYGNWVT